MIPTNCRSGSLPLDRRIHVLEQRLLERRQRIGAAAAGIGRGLRARMSTPAMLTVAVGFGVFLHRSREHRTGSMLTWLNAAYTTSSLVVSVSSWLSPAPQTTPPEDVHRSGIA